MWVENQSGQPAIVVVSRYNTTRELLQASLGINGGPGSGGLDASVQYNRNPARDQVQVVPPGQRHRFQLFSGTEGGFVSAVLVDDPLTAFFISKQVRRGYCLRFRGTAAIAVGPPFPAVRVGSGAAAS